MQTRALKTLLEIERLGSFVDVARQLNMTLSAVSMQIKSLEAELGTDLFDRAFRPPQLTPMGKSVCRNARAVVEAEAALIAACRPTDRLTGTFRLGVVPTASIRLLPGFLHRARQTAPEARFEIETGLSDALQTRLSAGQIDCAVVTATPGSQSGLVHHRLRRDRLDFVAPSEVADATPDALFRSHAFFHFLPQSGIGALIADHVARHAPDPGRTIYLDSVEAIMECVNAGLGFTLLPEPDIRRHLGGGARIVTTDEAVPTRDLVLAWPAKSRLAAQVARIAALFPDEGSAPLRPGGARHT